MTILKVQKPIVTSEADHPWLFYNEDRSINYQVPESKVSPQIKEAMGEENKIYVKAVDSKITKVQEQDW